MIELNGRIAIVTGGASGIGAASVRQLQQWGAKAVSWDFGDADVICDVSSQESVDDANAETIERSGPPYFFAARSDIASQ